MLTSNLNNRLLLSLYNYHLTYYYIILKWACFSLLCYYFRPYINKAVLQNITPQLYFICQLPPSNSLIQKGSKLYCFSHYMYSCSRYNMYFFFLHNSRLKEAPITWRTPQLLHIYRKSPLCRHLRATIMWLLVQRAAVDSSCATPFWWSINLNQQENIRMIVGEDN